MPRPKRTKVASRIAPTRVAEPAKPAAPEPRSQETVKPSQEQHDSFSDDSDGLVVKRTEPRVRRPWQPEPQQDVDLTMTGALPVGSDTYDTTRKTPGRYRLSHIAIPAGARSKPISNQSNSARSVDIINNAGVVPKSPNAAQLAATETEDAAADAESSLLDPSLLTFGSLDSDSPAHGTRPPSAMKVGGTPAHETSILALTNFRRRPRQPSLLRMVHPTTDVEDEDVDELDDFHPEDESTPIHVRTNDPSRETNDPSAPNISSSGSRGKKRKLSPPVVQVPRSSPPYDPPSGADVADSQMPSSPSLPENVMESREEVPETQEQAESDILSETMAPPRSSSPMENKVVDSPLKPRQRRQRAKSGRRGSDDELDKDQIHQRAKTKARQKGKAQNLSTARLQALLPRRRTRLAQDHDEYDFEPSDESQLAEIDPDQDELQLPPSRRATAKKRTASKPNRKPSRKIKKPAVSTNQAQKNTRTYGRRASSDKENESTFVVTDDAAEDDESTEITPALPRAKVAAIAKKFEDVDAWEMVFESVDVGGGSSSPWR
ncbi:hypothetical protein K491DRAFT_686543 [Lophiostoma macrostomum CBS 122681]|uniref:Uncharacterized protein n=1 Tax=Lophiostoma macrostomum CBS 122681 TaxID=1314788 RepID=A0A6A6TT99_9PLEO|nr:hypothetical protein K491DRAFT_686543 [Lophiostoma macrostomum CBS 122681]